MPENFRLGGIDAACVGPFCISIFSGKVSSNELFQLRDWLKVRLPALSYVHNVSVVMDSPGEIDPETRAAAAEVSKIYVGKAKAEAVVIETKGVKGSIVRGVVTSIHMLTPGIHKRKVFQTTNEALQWIGDEDPKAKEHIDAARRFVDSARL